jgi:Rad3-related DNA helicase
VLKEAAHVLSAGGPIAERLGGVGGGYESRPEQASMAEAVARALETRSRLLVEAGTGVGKSFAYLVPAILRCVLMGEKVVIATATIALQEQLMAKDIPMLQETLERWGVEMPHALKPVLAKGRGNYLSTRRLQIASKRQDAVLHDAESRISLEQIQQWAYHTRDGTLSSLPLLPRPEVWEHVRSDADNCMGRKCPTYDKCFYQSARRELESANLIVCNHALFFADLALRVRAGATSGPTAATARAILPRYDHVIFDEAHGLEDAASEHFGLSLSRAKALRLLRTLYNPRRRKGYLLDKSLLIGETGSVDRALTLVVEAMHAAETFFEDLREHAARMPGGSGRVRTPNVVDNPLTPAMHALALRLRLLREQVPGEGHQAESERFELASFARRAQEIGDATDAMVGQTLRDYVYWIETEGSGGSGPGPRRPARGDDDDDAGPGIESAPGGQGPAGQGPGGPVFPSAIRGPGPRFARVTLACAPVDVASILRKHLFSPGAAPLEAPIDEGGDPDGPHPHDADDPGASEGVSISEADLEAMLADRASDAPAVPPASVPGSGSGPGPAAGAPPKPIGIVLTSATLATRTVAPGAHPEHAETAFAHAMNNLGIDHATTLQLGSPFDYARQARVVIDLTLPDPRGGAPRAAGVQPGGARRGPGGFDDALTERVLHHVRSTGGGAFVLFTSNATMFAVADRLGPRLRRLGLPLLVQGRDGPRTMILKAFTEADDAVLLGAASFWQGVDVRGERLRNVIITRLPFEPPDRPLTQARCERIERTGANPFMVDALPRAIIKFKQGFGRLIRSRSDTGRVVVLDPRIATARYGRMFLEALPPGLPVDILRADDFDDPGAGDDTF